MISEVEFHTKCHEYSEKMNSILAERDGSTTGLERELSLVEEVLAFLINDGPAAPAYMQASIESEIEHRRFTVQLIAEALLRRRAAEGEALLAAQGNTVTIQ